MIPEHFVISEFLTLFIAVDPAGSRRVFSDRRSACFILPRKGRIRFSYQGGSVTASAEQPVFLPKGLHYVNECLESAESYVFNFQTAGHYGAPIPLRAISLEQAEESYGRICGAALGSSLQSTLLIMEELYALARRLLAVDETFDSAHPIVRAATDYLRRNYAVATLTAGDVARHCCISEVYLRKLFERELSTPPHRYLTSLRMREARLLIEEKRPLKEVAVRVGYSDVYQFSRAYKRYFGHAPSKG